MEISMNVIAKVHSDFPSKFGIPRQAGLVPELRAFLVFEPAFRNPDMLRGLEGFSHIWLIWNFSGNRQGGWAPTVRPPRLGGNRRMGGLCHPFPFRPNPMGLSCVRLDEIQWDTPQGPMLVLSGADLMDGTPVFDIKPYVPYADCRPEATGGFTEQAGDFLLEVSFPPLPYWLKFLRPSGRPFWGYWRTIHALPISTIRSESTDSASAATTFASRVDGKLLTVCQLEPFPTSP